MVQLKYIFILFFFSTILKAQPFQTHIVPSRLISQDKDLGIKTLSTTYADSALLLVSEVLPIQIDSIVTTENLTIQPGSQKIADSNSTFSEPLGEALSFQGSFDTDIADSKGTGWSYNSNGWYECDGTQSSATQLRFHSVVSSPINKTYGYRFRMWDIEAGTMNFYIGGYNAAETVSADGWYSGEHTPTHASSNDNLYFTGDATFIGKLDNIEVWEITHDWESNGHATFIPFNDSTMRYSNVPTELNPNPNFDNWSYADSVANGDIEVGLPTFNGVSITNFQASTAQSTDFAYSGSNSAKVTSTASSGSMDARFVDSGWDDRYIWVECWVYNPTGNTSTIYLKSYINSSYTTVAETSVKDTWTKLSGVVYVGSGSVGSDRYFMLQTSSLSSVGQIFYFDDVKIYYSLVAPDGWTASTMDEDNYVIEDDDGARLVSDGTWTYITLGLTTGKSYEVYYDVEVTTGGINIKYNGGTSTTISSTSTGTLTSTFENITGNTLYIERKSGVGACDVTIKEIRVKEYHPTEDNNIYLPITTTADQGYDLTFDYKKDTKDVKVHYSYGSHQDSTNTVTSSFQTETLSFIRSGSDTLKIWLDSANAKVKLDNIQLTSDANNFVINYGDSVYVDFTADISTAGDYDEDIIYYHTGYGSPDTSEISWTVASAYNLIVESTITFDTASVLTQDYLSIENQSEEPIGSIAYSGLSSPFTLSNTITTLPADSVHDITVNFYASSNGTYTDTLVITSTADSSPDSVIISGTWYVPTSSSEWFLASPGGGGWHQDFEVSPVDSSYIYACTDLSGFWYSDDFGQTFTSSNPDSGDYEGADISCHPDSLGVVYYVSGSGIWKTWNHGVDWTRLGTGQIYGEQEWINDLGIGDSSNFSAIYVNPYNPDYVYAGTGTSHGVLASSKSSQGFPNPCRFAISTDAGVTWSYPTNTNLPTTTNAFDDFAVMPNSPEIILGATRQGLYKTTNSGSSWTRIYTKMVKAVEIDPTDSSNAWIIADYWNDYNTELKYSNNILSATTSSGWSDGSGDLNTSSIAKYGDIRFANNGYLYLTFIARGTIPRVQYTENDGINWNGFTGTISKLTYEGGDYYPEGTSLGISLEGNVITYGYDSPITSANAGTDYTNADFHSGSSEEEDTDYWRGIGTDVLVVNDISVSGDTVLMVASDQGVFISYDGAYSWYNISAENSAFSYFNGSAGACEIMPSNSDEMYVSIQREGGSPEYKSQLFRSDNGGVTWTELKPGVNTNLTDTLGWVALEGDSDGDIFALDYHGGRNLYKSSNKGQTWTVLSTPILAKNIRFYKGNNDIIWLPQQGELEVNGIYGGLAYSTNGGTSWTQVQDTLLGRVEDVAIHPTNSNYLYCAVDGSFYNTFGDIQGFTPSPGGIMKSTDGGTTWTRVLSPTNGLNDGKYQGVAFNPIDASRVYAVQEKIGRYKDRSIGDGVMVSADSGATWSELGDIPIKSINTMEFDRDGNLYVGLNTGGVYKYGTSGGAITAPVIASTSVTVDFPNLEALVRVNFDDGNSDNVVAYSHVGGDTTNWSSSMDVMNVYSGYATLNYEGLNSGDTLYFKSLVSNETGEDTSDAEQFVIEASGASTIDTFYATTNYDNVWRYGSDKVRAYDYIHIGNSYGQPNSGGFRFGGINDMSVDSAKIELILHTNFADTITVDIYGENNGSPSVYLQDNISDFDNRTTTTAKTSLSNYSASLSDGDTVSYDVTSIIAELMGSYNYSNGYINIMILDNGTASTSGEADDYRTICISTYRKSSGSEQPKLIIWGTQ